MTNSKRSSWNVAVWRRVLGIALLSFTSIEGCQDSNIHCSYWALLGECKKNPNYMLYNCRKSCNTCKSLGNFVKWPSGKYGLPMAKSGCPKSDGFSWKTGYIYQDLEDDKSLTANSPSFHLNASVLSLGDVSQSFCFKTNRTDSVDNSRFSWPYGQYCIYKKGSSCPGSLKEGRVLWDDENGQNGINLNFKTGTVPAGTYNADTEIKFCCQDVGSYSEPIELPIDKPFYLIAFNSKNCQEVLKTTHTLEYILYDTENDRNHNQAVYPYPFGSDGGDPYIYYCYYQACRWTLKALNGSFSSPNYPSPYKEKALCEWHITVPWNYIISLTFVDFRLETSDMCLYQSCDCDFVEVHDNFPNGTSELTGKYCMGVAYPPSDIRSKTNNVTVTFSSDGTIQDVGFKAEYSAVQLTAPTSLRSTTDTKQKTTPTDYTSVDPPTVPITGATSRGTTNGNDKSTTAGNTAPTTSLGSSSSSSSSNITTGTTTRPVKESSTERTTTHSNGHPTSQKASSLTMNPNGTFTPPFTNVPATTMLITSEMPPRTRPRKTVQSSSTSGVTTGELFPPTEPRSKGGPDTSSRASRGNIFIITALIASLVVLAVIATVAIVCLCRKWYG
ncbi:uncharacterized protein LOC111333551 [Stylophora pistillata]|uniref:uncharacterized protein LOC111333551 n=1 Tax=Stylophora pistillata TaxID=50429 RepID=UPI000C04A1FF|nr:uncharacterized protein LOC111333551 [Stylophora pistillata]